MARQEAPLEGFPMEAVIEHALEAPVEMKNKVSGEVLITILAARKGHPNYEPHITTVIEQQILSDKAQGFIQYPVGSDKLHSRIASALNLPVVPQEGTELPLPIYENFRLLGQIHFSEEEKQKAIEAIRVAETVVLVRIAKDSNNQEQSILLLDNGGQGIPVEAATLVAD